MKMKSLHQGVACGTKSITFIKWSPLVPEGFTCDTTLISSSNGRRPIKIETEAAGGRRPYQMVVEDHEKDDRRLNPNRRLVTRNPGVCWSKTMSTEGWKKKEEEPTSGSPCSTEG